jgi:hypothetical protein
MNKRWGGGEREKRRAEEGRTCERVTVKRFSGSRSSTRPCIVPTAKGRLKKKREIRLKFSRKREGEALK